MPICANLGQTAGVSAALSVEQGVKPRELSPGAIEEVLRSSGRTLIAPSLSPPNRGIACNAAMVLHD
jgi:hypothetical protein